jgi:hypothetical protein
MQERRSRGQRSRAGMTVSELLVSATLLLSLIAVIAPITVRAGRIWQESRTYQFALEELTNELEHLTSLSPEERQTALEQWQPTPSVSLRLPDAKLNARTLEDDDGERLVLTLDWDRIPGAPPLTLVGWIMPQDD